MRLSRRTLLAASAASAAAMPAGARAAQPIRIGVMNDMSGPYRDLGGMGSVVCARQAVQDFGDHGWPAEVVFADHQNKPDVGAAIARQWLDQDGVDVIVDVNTSSVALAVSAVVREKNKVLLVSGSGTTDLTGAQCSPNTVHWTYDTYMLARSTGGAAVQAGGESWYFVTADYGFGHQLERDATRFIQAAGGKVLGSVAYPFPGTSDFSAFLLGAQASGAKILGLANAGADTITCVKQAREFGLTGTMRLAALLMGLSDVHGLGLAAAQGLLLTESFYWDLNPSTRAFTARVRDKTPENWPNMEPAGCYAASLHFLKAVASLGLPAARASGRDIVARMKALPTEDDAFGRGSIRADGRGLFPAYLFQVKTPAESRGKFDYYKLVRTTPPEQAWRPLAEGGCALIPT